MAWKRKPVCTELTFAVETQVTCVKKCDRRCACVPEVRAARRGHREVRWNDAHVCQSYAQHTEAIVKWKHRWHLWSVLFWNTIHINGSHCLTSCVWSLFYLWDHDVLEALRLPEKLLWRFQVHRQPDGRLSQADASSADTLCAIPWANWKWPHSLLCQHDPDNGIL